jgi:peptidoglycan hydrolase-like protein with peptidoglycan-binding domain
MTAPEHRKIKGPRRRLGPARTAGVVGVVVLAAGVTIGAFALSGRATPVASSTGTKSPPSAPPTTLALPTTTLPPITALTVRSVTPAKGAVGVATDHAVAIRFSVPPTASPAPTLSPAVAGHWAIQGDAWAFHPTAGYIPGTTETVSVPARTTAREEGRQVHLATAYKSTFTVGPGSVLRLQQILAELRYLPFTFTPTAPAARPGSRSTAGSTRVTTGLEGEPSVAAAVVVQARPGHLTWAYPDIPPSLAALWVKGQANEVTKGAVMAFEADHGLGVDGVAGPQVWTALIHAVAARQTDPRPYSYVEVTENDPEVLTVWQAGHADVYSSPANTGVTGAATALGTFPVFLRYAVHEMKGTEPNGQKYDDPAIPWIAYFNGGDAIHGYPRSSYGFPQSNGCVELPIPNAEAMYNSGDDWYGTLVSVT